MPNLSWKEKSAGWRQTIRNAWLFRRAGTGWFLVQTALIVLACWWVFSPAFHGGWIWDDNSEILQNPLLRDPDALGKIWLDPVSPDYFPLKTAVQWVQWRLWQDHTFGYHLSGAGLHLLSALLLWRLFWKLGLRAAWIGGLLFALHPVAVESVAWIAELKNTLSLPLLLLAMCAWLDYDTRGWRTDWVRSLLLFLAAMLCKSSAVMFPVILLLYAWWKRGKIAREDLKAGAAFFAISLGLGLVTVWFQHHRAIGSDLIPAGGFFPRLARAGVALLFYFSKCVFPVGLLPAYPRWTLNPPSPVQFLPWLLLGAVLCGLWARRATWGRHLLFGGGCFLVNLLPVLGFIPMSYMRVSWVADHFVYLPLTGLIGLVTAGVGAAGARLSALVRPYALGGMVLALGLFAFQGNRYAGIFRSDEILWTYVQERNPETWLAPHNLGLALFQAGRVAEAMKYYREALRLNPDSADAHYNLGIALFQTGRIPEAVAHYEQALRIRPDDGEAHYNLGVALFLQGRMVEAVSHYEQALRINPNYGIHLNLGGALLKMGRMAEALGHYGEALRLQPNSADAHYNLGFALAQMDRIPEAMRHYEQTLRIRPDYWEAHYNLGVALFRQGRMAEAVSHYEQALRIKPNYAIHLNLGGALLKMGRIAEALDHYGEALRFQPDSAAAHYNLGFALAKAGRLMEAIRHYEEALQLKPDYAEAHNNLGITLTQMGRVSEAIRHYGEALRIKPDYAEAHNNMGNALLQAGRLAEAKEQYEQALQISPDYASARINLARLKTLHEPFH